MFCRTRGLLARKRAKRASNWGSEDVRNGSLSSSRLQLTVFSDSAKSRFRGRAWRKMGRTCERRNNQLESMN